MRRPTLALIAVLAIWLTACSPQPPEFGANDQVPAAQRIAETEPGSTEGGGGGGDFADADAVWVATATLTFSQAPDSVPADGALLGLQIEGGVPHNVVFEGFEGDRALVEGSGEGEYADNASIPAGTYTYYCSIPGHRATMEGQVTVG
ncbi:MAG: plastocyanin/azurin family copper-binding protein [Euzebya sp.]